MSSQEPAGPIMKFQTDLYSISSCRIYWKCQTVSDSTFYFLQSDHLLERDYIFSSKISRTWKNIFTNGIFWMNLTSKDSTLCEGFFLILLELGEPLNLRVNFFVDTHGTILTSDESASSVLIWHLIPLAPSLASRLIVPSRFQQYTLNW